MATSEAGGGGRAEGEVELLVCMTCGREYQFEGGESPPEDLKCEKCGGEVFRRFEDAAVPDEVQAEFREETERDLATSDPEGDATRGDLHDLNP
jgi:DNA-directed RNA polymerase subunit RPC12/RpoP